jgi:hypothetical protein
VVTGRFDVRLFPVGLLGHFDPGGAMARMGRLRRRLRGR